MKNSAIKLAVGAVVLSLAVSILPASAATPGVGDLTDAMRYGAGAPIGTILDFDAVDGNEDDAGVTVPAAFPMNFFGTKYEHICISINGGVFPTNDPTLDCSAYDENLEDLAMDAESPMVAVLALDVDLTMCDESLGTFNVERDRVVGTNDGFGVPCSVYYGTTTVDGAEAMVATWYRVPNNDGGNTPSLTNTFQLLLTKKATGSVEAGWDFAFEFNYGTLKDDEDGYAMNAEGVYDGDSCDAYEGDPVNTKTETYDLCRWGVGVANFIPNADPSLEGTGVGYEFFAAANIGQLIDGGDKAMISNKLGTTVLGRYTCMMISGQTQGCDPVFSAGPPLDIRPLALDLALDATTGVVVPGGQVRLQGGGLIANSPLELVMRSTPVVINLNGQTADASGNFDFRATLPASISAGVHSLTLTGTKPDGTPISDLLYFEIDASGKLLWSQADTPKALAKTGADSFATGGLVLAALALIGFGVALTASRRTKKA
jgi:hypothetical protein